MSLGISHPGKIRVGVLRGGRSHEYSVSMQTGLHVLKNLPEKYVPIDIYISKEGVWHVGGLERNPTKALEQVDVVWNALHGKYGEDGKVQTILDTLKKPYTGSRALASSMGMHKGFSKAAFSMFGLQTPHHIILSPKDNVRKNLIEIFQSFPQPSIVKPVDGGSSIAVTVTYDFSSFERAVELAFRHSGSVVVEEYIKGREATCGVIEGTDNKSIFALIPVELVPDESKLFFDYQAKHGNGGSMVCPSTFSEDIKQEIQNLAIEAHRALGLRHYSRSDFIVSPQRGIFLLEANLLPGLAQGSLFPVSLEASGLTLSDFLDHVLTLTIK